MKLFKKISKDSPIGVFDSGIGGLTVLSELKKILPNEKFIYVGDEANFPYGEKTIEEIRECSLDICYWLMKQNVKMIVIACNTITAAALDYIKHAVDVDVIGVIDSGVKAALEVSKNRNIGVIATRATINMGIFHEKLFEKSAGIHVVGVGAPELVSYVEKDLDMVLNNPSDEFLKVVNDYTKAFKENDCDTLILGCTHFPPLEKVLQNSLGPSVNIVSPSLKTAEASRDILKENNLLSSSAGSCSYYTTGNDEKKFDKFASIIMGDDVEVCRLS